MLYEAKDYQNHFFDASQCLKQKYDNIYCNGQSIAIEVSRYNDIMFICCATSGDVDTSEKIKYKSNDILDINLRITDFRERPNLMNQYAGKEKQ